MRECTLPIPVQHENVQASSSEMELEEALELRSGRQDCGASLHDESGRSIVLHG